MALATYSDLKASIANWLHRSDLDAMIPDFIAMAESRINRLMQVRGMEVDAPLTMAPGSRYVALPDDFNTPIALWLESFQPRLKLTPALADQLVVSPVAGYPEYWAIDGANIAVDKPAASNYPLTLRYHKTLRLSDSSQTNTVLTEYPDLYLFGSLLEAAPYMRDDARIAVWQERFDRAVKEISDNETENRSVAPLRTELTAIQRGNRFNIFRGW
jgi:hypothetical protein